MKCIQNNNNKVIGGGEEPETASLTVNKEVFGCNIIGGEFNTSIICDQLQSNSTDWLPCTNPEISNFTFITICKKLTDNLNLLDIEVLDSQDIQLEKFEASAQGTTVQNLQAGTYGVKEIKDPSIFFPVNVLYVAAQTEEDCLNNGFSDGGDMFINVNVPPEPTCTI